MPWKAFTTELATPVPTRTEKQKQRSRQSITCCSSPSWSGRCRACLAVGDRPVLALAELGRANFAEGLIAQRVGAAVLANPVEVDEGVDLAFAQAASATATRRWQYHLSPSS